MPRKTRVVKRPAGDKTVVVGYPRVSTDEQARDGKSLENQEQKIRLFCELHDLHLLRMVADPGQSAKSLDRPGVKEALDDLDKGRADGLVVTKLDRLTRSLSDWSYLIERYFSERAGRSLFSVGDSIDTRTANGRMVLYIIMTIAQWEREVIAERTSDTLQGKIRRGERCGRVRYGYGLDEDGPRNPKTGLPMNLVPIEEEQRTIALMRRWKDEGREYREMVELLRQLGIETKSGGQIWLPATIHRILRRPIP